MGQTHTTAYNFSFVYDILLPPDIKWLNNTWF